MKNLYIYLIVLLFSISLMANKGDIISVTVDQEGWFVRVVVDSLDSIGLYDMGMDSINSDYQNAKFKLYATYPGWYTGGDTNYIDTIYAITRMRDTFSNEALNDEFKTDTTLTFKLTLSEPIYTECINLTCDIDDSLYLDTIQDIPSSDTIGLTVTNSSTRAYDDIRVVANWTYPGFRVVQDDFKVYMQGYHRSARYKKPLAFVVFTAKDESGDTYRDTITTPTIDTTLGDTGSIIDYSCTIDVSGFTIGDTIKVDFTVYPWYGDTQTSGDGANSHPTPLYTTQLFRYVSDVKLAVVDSVNGDNGTGQVINASTFDTASPPNPFLTLQGAINATRTAIGAADISGSRFLLRNGGYNIFNGTITSGTYTDFWMVIEEYPGDTARLIGRTESMPVNSYIRVRGIDIVHTASNLLTGEEAVWIDSCIVNNPGGLAMYDNTLNYLTNSRLQDNLKIPFATENSSPAIFRGNVITMPSSERLAVYVYTGNITTNTNGYYFDTDYSVFNLPPIDNAIMSFNIMSIATSYGHWYNDSACTHGMAVIQNVMEKITTTEPLFYIGADASISDPVNNIIIWYNTMVGQRFNGPYNDYNLNGTYAFRSDWSVKNNIIERSSHVTDKDAHGGTPGAPRTGNWQEYFGNSYISNLTLSSPYPQFNFGIHGDYRNLAFGPATGAYPQYVDNASYTGDASGNGDYHLTSGSPAIDRLAFGEKGILLPLDIEGKLRFDDAFSDTIGGSIGAYEYGEPTLIVVDSVTATKQSIKFYLTTVEDTIIVRCSTFSALHSIDTMINTDTLTVPNLCYFTKVNYDVGGLVLDTIRTLDLDYTPTEFRRIGKPDTIRTAFKIYSNKQDSCLTRYKGDTITGINIRAYSFNVGGDTTDLTISTVPFRFSSFWFLDLYKTEYDSIPADTLMEFIIGGIEIDTTKPMKVIHE